MYHKSTLPRRGGLQARSAVVLTFLLSIFTPASAITFPSLFDPATLTGSNGLRADGAAVGDSSGRSIRSIGDINGDGHDDFAVAARLADNGGTETGSLYVIFGSELPFSDDFDLTSLDSSKGFRIDGVAFNDHPRATMANQPYSWSTLASKSTAPEPESDVEIPCCGPEFWLYAGLCMGLVIFAALMAGLTMAYMSLDSSYITILEETGTPQNKKYARAIAPLVRRRHLLLVTLLVGNASAMEALPIFLDKMVPNWLAIILSVTLVLIFGEIVPQAVFTKYRLPIGSALSGFVLLLEFIILPIGWPIGKLLDLMLGEDHPTIYRRAEFKAFTKQHIMKEDGEGSLTQDEVKVITSVVDFGKKIARTAMQPIETLYALSEETVLDEPTLRGIMSRGHSRIPIFRESDGHFQKLLIVKNVISVDPNLNVKIKDVESLPDCRRAMTLISRVSEEMPLWDLLAEFREGRTHLALVVDSAEDIGAGTYSDLEKVKGIITLEDVIEELLQAEIADETDLSAQAQNLLLMQREGSLKALQPGAKSASLTPGQRKGWKAPAIRGSSFRLKGEVRREMVTSPHGSTRVITAAEDAHGEEEEVQEAGAGSKLTSKLLQARSVSMR